VSQPSADEKEGMLFWFSAIMWMSSIFVMALKNQGSPLVKELAN